MMPSSHYHKNIVPSNTSFTDMGNMIEIITMSNTLSNHSYVKYIII